MSAVPVFLAFGAGVVSFLSPCILPLAPGYISYLAGVSTSPGEGETGKSPVIARAALFNAGFIMVFVLMGATGSYIGKAFLSYRPLMAKLGGIFIFIMGLQMTGLIKLQLLYRTYRPGGSLKLSGPLGAFLMGVTFAAGWTPCVGPVLASILVYAGISGTVTRGVVLLGAYSLGLAVPFMLMALALERGINLLPRFNRLLAGVSLASGIVLMAVGALLFLNLFPRISALLIF